MSEERQHHYAVDTKQVSMNNCNYTDINIKRVDLDVIVKLDK
jgi:hypothetical protein